MIEDIFTRQPINGDIKKHARIFMAEINKIDDPKRLEIIRHRLNGLAKKCPRKVGYVHAVICAVKHRQKSFLDKPVAENFGRDHVMTDHAFVQYLRRAHGLDIEALKDRAVEQNESHKLVKFCYTNGKILTVMPWDKTGENPA